MSDRVKPLTKRTMTLSELQLRVLDVLRKVKFQFGMAAHEEGMSDAVDRAEGVLKAATDARPDPEPKGPTA